MAEARFGNRRGLALPIVLAVIVFLSILAMGLFMFTRGSLRNTGRVVADVEHLYRAEAIFHRVLNRLKGAPWQERYYVTAGRANASATETGSYREASYELWLQDLADEDGQAIPGLVDMLIRVDFNGVQRNFACRIRMVEAPRSTCRTEAYHFQRVKEPLESSAGRRRAVEGMNRAEARREANRAESDTVARVIREGGASGESTTALLDRLRSDGSLRRRIEERERVLEAIRQALHALGHRGRPLADLVGQANGFTLRGMKGKGDPVRARSLLQPLLDRMESRGDDESADFARLLAFLLARARRDEIEDMSADDPLRKLRVRELNVLVAAMAERERRRLRDRPGPDTEEWELGPYIFLELARAQAHQALYERPKWNDSKDSLREMAERFPDHRLWGGDVSVELLREAPEGLLEAALVPRLRVPSAWLRQIPALEAARVFPASLLDSDGNLAGAGGNVPPESANLGTPSVNLPTLPPVNPDVGDSGPAPTVPPTSTAPSPPIGMIAVTETLAEALSEAVSTSVGPSGSLIESLAAVTIDSPLTDGGSSTSTQVSQPTEAVKDDGVVPIKTKSIDPHGNSGNTTNDAPSTVAPETGLTQKGEKKITSNTVK